MITKNNIIQQIIKKSLNPELIEEVFGFAEEAYKGRFRLSDEPYIEHALRVAKRLDEMGLDSKIISAGILHDVLDDLPGAAKKIHVQEIEKKFGKEIAYLVERISEISKIRYSLATNVKEKKVFTKEKIENLRKMFFALAGDPRAILIELVSRLDGLSLC